jgi:octaprenyl-diphosphate synthase
MNELQEYFARELPRINAQLAEETGRLEGLVRDVAGFVLLAPGKRLRPLLVLLTARALGYRTDDAYPLACALEILHAATLLHDDILDGAGTRRGKAAAHKTFGTQETILAGDALLALANRIGAAYGDARLSFHLAEGIMETAVGEIREIEALRAPSASRDTYLDIITGKTACLIRASCRLGAVLAKAGDEACAAAAEYGLCVGVAFQLVDDALDYELPSRDIGKPVGGDVLEGKVTWPLILYLENAPEGERAAILASLAEGLPREEAATLVARVREAGYAARTRQFAAEYVERAKSALSIFPPSVETDRLNQAADFILTRTR